MKNTYIVGIDSGTSMVKASLFDFQGHEIAVAHRKTPTFELRPGWSEFNMDVDWRETGLAVKELLAKADVHRDEIQAVGVTGKGIGCCFVDKYFRPIRAGILWNDARTLPLMEGWIADGRMDEIFEISGNWLIPGDLGLLIPWLAEHEPKALASAHTIVLPTTRLTWKMTGEHIANRADVYSQLNASTGEYSERIFELEGITDWQSLFPRLADPWEIAGTVHAAAAEETGLAEGTPVVRLGLDLVACAAGVGAVADGQANIILGTTGAIEVVSSQPRFTPKNMGLQFIHSIPGKWLQLIAPMTITPHLDWYINTMGFADKVRADTEERSLFSILDEEVAKIEPGSRGVIFHPYMSAAGERAPFTKTSAKANFFGLDLRSDRHVLLRAIYEGIALANKHCLDAFPTAIRDIRLSGGGSKSAGWCQIFADVFNETIRIPSGTELGAKGAAWNAAFALGLFKTRQEAIDSFCRVERVYEPNLHRAEIYSEVYEIYKQLIPNMFEAWDARASFLNPKDTAVGAA
jgi:sugar (pentulose or hexulose) kinase